MTAIKHNAAATLRPTTQAEVKKMLHDLAYALKLSRLVSAEILAEREARKGGVIRTSEVASGLTQTARSSAVAVRLSS